MKNRLLFLLLIAIILFSCSKPEDTVFPVSGLSKYEITVIRYFKDIALGFEYGNASRITRKWKSELRIFVGGVANSELRNEINKIKTEINKLASDGFRMKVVNDSLQSNYYIFFGTGKKYAEIFPSQSKFVDLNWGLFSVSWNTQNQFYFGHMYVDITRANLIEQKHLLREELTQSLGLANDSYRYMESIFQSAWTNTNEYALIDKDLIRLLYHSEMSVGLNEGQVTKVLSKIFISE